MSVTISSRQIYAAAQQLVNAWQELNETWDDPVADAINRRYIRLLDQEVRTTLTAAERMHEILEEAVQVLATHDDAPYGMRRSRLPDPDAPGR
ncbi:MAG: hypothetical protein CMJ29_09505 [Phycisphaerae bacterium]|nr:hypothetical protein [Phycisphaerae bacterium]